MTAPPPPQMVALLRRRLAAGATGTSACVLGAREFHTVRVLRRIWFNRRWPAVAAMLISQVRARRHMLLAVAVVVVVCVCGGGGGGGCVWGGYGAQLWLQGVPGLLLDLMLAFPGHSLLHAEVSSQTRVAARARRPAARRYKTCCQTAL